MRVQQITRGLHRIGLNSRMSISILVVFVCVVLFIVITVLDMMHLFSKQQTVSILGLSYQGVFEKLWIFQFLSAPLLHVNHMHLIFNMLALWWLGPAVEEAIGRYRYIYFSLFCSGCALAGFLLIDRGAGTIVLGYSGVIFGILTAYAIFFPNRTIYLYIFFPMKMKYAVIIMGAIELYLTFSSTHDQVAHSAHLFGAVGAWIYLKGIRWQDRARRRETRFTPFRRSESDGLINGVPSPARSTRATRRTTPSPVCEGPEIGIAAEIRQSHYVQAIEMLRKIRAPRKTNSVRVSLRDLAGLLDKLNERGRTEDDMVRIHECLKRAWDAAVSAKMPGILPELAAIAAEEHIEDMAGKIVNSFGSSLLSYSPGSVLDRLKNSLNQMGEAGFETLLGRLANTRNGDQTGNWLLDALISMQPGRYASSLVRFYSRQNRQVQSCVVLWLCNLSSQSFNILLDIMDGVLQKLPPDLRLVVAIQNQLGAACLEKEAIKWAAGGHKGAQTVLQRMYKYPESAF